MRKIDTKRAAKELRAEGLKDYQISQRLAAAKRADDRSQAREVKEARRHNGM
jgi:hypothetical protein